MHHACRVTGRATATMHGTPDASWTGSVRACVRGGNWRERHRLHGGKASKQASKPPRASGWDVDVDTTFGEPWAGPSLLQPSLLARPPPPPHAARPWGLAATVVVVFPPVRQHPWRALQGWRFRAAAPPARARRREGGGERAAAARYGPPMEQVGASASPARCIHHRFQQYSGSTSAHLR